jgi:hypothetical protein
METRHGVHRTTPSRWEVFAWITLQAVALTGGMLAVVAGVYAVSVLMGGTWR